MKRIILAFMFLCAMAAIAPAQLTQTTITGTLYKVDGTTCNSCQLKIVKVYKSGQVVSLTQATVTSHASLGTVSFTVPRASIAWISGNFLGFSQCGSAGCPVSIPDAASASLETLAPSITNIPNTVPVAARLLNVKEADGSPNVTDVKTIVVSNGTLTDDGSGQVTVTTGAGGGGGSLTVEEADSSPQVSSVTTLRFDQADGFVVTTPGAGIARVDLAAVPYSALTLTGSIVNADIGNSAAIAYSKLNLAGSIVNADVGNSAAIAYSKLNLASSIVNADIGNSAAIAYSKLNLTGAILNADLAGSIAISKLSITGTPDGTKFLRDDGSWQVPAGGGSLTAREVDGTPSMTATTIEVNQADGLVGTDQGSSVFRIALSSIPHARMAALTASRALASDGSGVVAVTAVTSTELGYVSGVTSAIQTQLDAKAAASTTLTAGAGLTGGGDLSAGRTFDVGAGTGITVNANDVAVNQAFTPTWTGAHVFNPGTTPSDSITLTIAAIGSAGTRDSHNLVFRGASDDGSAHTIDWRHFADVTSNAGASTWTIQSRVDAGSYATRFSVTDGGTVAGTIFDASTGYRVAGGATSGQYLRGNGTNFVSAAIQAGDLPDLSGTYQPLDSDLTALAGNGTNGLWARTGAGTGAARTLTAGVGITVSNGDGVSGNPTIAADINGLTAVTGIFATGDEFAYYDAAAGGIRKATLARVSSFRHDLFEIVRPNNPTGERVFFDASGVSSRTFGFPNADGTLVTATATQTLTNKTISGSNNTLSNIANASLTNSAITIAGNSTALGDSITASTILDSISSTRGTILYRGASGWAALAPGTSGHVLTSNGAGADPSYQAGGGGTAWSGITNPSGNLSLTMGTNTTTFNWATGSSTSNLFSVTTDTDANGTGYLLDVGATGAANTVKPFRVRARGVTAIDVAAAPGTGTTIKGGGGTLSLNDGSGAVLSFGSSNITVATNITFTTSGAVTIPVISGNSSVGLTLYADQGGGTNGKPVRTQMYNGSSFRTTLETQNTTGGAEPELWLVPNGGLLGVNKTTSLGAQIHVLSGSASRIGFRVDSASSPSVDIAQFTINGSTTAGAYAGVKLGGTIFGVRATYTESGSGTSINLNNGNFHTVTLTGSGGTLTPTNVPNSSTITIAVVQDGTGSRTVTWASAFKWVGGAAPTLSTAASARDVFVFSCDGTNCYENARALDVR